MEIFKYGNHEIEYLKKKDKKLGKVIEQMGMIQREVIPDLFSALVNSIVGQQISAKAATTVWNRMIEHFGMITPYNISVATIEEIQKCGLSTRKASYIKNIGETVCKGEINLDEFHQLSEKEIIEKLSSLNGIGIWTAEMLMIFSMERPDVVSWGDLAIRRGMMKLYGLKTITKEQFDKYKKRYSPYGSVASLYLWAVSKE